MLRFDGIDVSQVIDIHKTNDFQEYKFIIFFSIYFSLDFCHNKYLKIKVNSDDNLSLKNFRYE